MHVEMHHKDSPHPLQNASPLFARLPHRPQKLVEADPIRVEAVVERTD